MFTYSIYSHPFFNIKLFLLFPILSSITRTDTSSALQIVLLNQMVVPEDETLDRSHFIASSLRPYCLGKEKESKYADLVVVIFHAETSKHQKNFSNQPSLETVNWGSFAIHIPQAVNKCFRLTTKITENFLIAIYTRVNSLWSPIKMDSFEIMDRSSDSFDNLLYSLSRQPSFPHAVNCIIQSGKLPLTVQVVVVKYPDGLEFYDERINFYQNVYKRFIHTSRYHFLIYTGLLNFRKQLYPPLNYKKGTTNSGIWLSPEFAFLGLSTEELEQKNYEAYEQQIGEAEKNFTLKGILDNIKAKEKEWDQLWYFQKVSNGFHEFIEGEKIEKGNLYKYDKKNALERRIRETEKTRPMAPYFPIRTLVQGNYNRGETKIVTINDDYYKQTASFLNPKNVTEIGFLIGNFSSNKPNFLIQNTSGKLTLSLKLNSNLFSSSTMKFDLHPKIKISIHGKNSEELYSHEINEIIYKSLNVIGPIKINLKDVERFLYYREENIFQIYLKIERKEKEGGVERETILLIAKKYMGSRDVNYNTWSMDLIDEPGFYRGYVIVQTEFSSNRV